MFRKRIILPVLSIVLLLASCGLAGDEESQEIPEAAPVTVTEEADQVEEGTVLQEEEPPHLRLVRDESGEVEIPIAPMRILDLSGRSEYLAILGLPLVGSLNEDPFAAYRPIAYQEELLGDIQILGSMLEYELDPDQVADLQPDLILISEPLKSHLSLLRQTALVLLMPEVHQSWKEELTALAVMFEREAEALEWLSLYDARVDAVAMTIKELTGGQTTWMVSLYADSNFFLLCDEDIGILMREELGLAWPSGIPERQSDALLVLKVEDLAGLGAEAWLILSTEENWNTLQKNTVWQALNTVKEGQAYHLTAAPYLRQAENFYGRFLLMQDLLERVQLSSDGH